MVNNERVRFLGSGARRPTAATALAVASSLWLADASAAPNKCHGQLPPGVAEVASVEGITEYALENGLRFLLFPDQSKQRITVAITYLVGSRHEGYGETGMAHLLEHLVFKGTPNHPDIPDELTQRAAIPFGSTDFDRTNYFEILPASEDNLEWALDLEADRMVNSFISAEDLESEMTVVRNEWETGEDSPSRALEKRVLAAAFDWHNYGKSTTGARADIENVPIDRLQAFYRKYYQPDNAILVVAGRFDPGHAIATVAEKFGSIPRPDRFGANQLFATYTAEPAQEGERTVTLRRVGDVQLALAAYHMPPGSHEHFAAVDVLAHILSTEPTGRLYRDLVEPGLAAETSAFTFQLKEPGVLLTRAEVREGGSLEQAAEAMVGVVEGIADEPPSEEEVERAKTEFRSSAERRFNNSEQIAFQLGKWASMGDWRLFFLHRDRLEEVTPQAVQQVARAYLDPSNRTMGFFYPTDEPPFRAEMPAAPDVGELVATYQGREAVAAGEAFEPTIENIESRTMRAELPVGLKVAFLPKENRGDAVTVRFRFEHGTEDALMGASTAASFAGRMLMRGTEQRSRQEITDELQRLQAQGSVSGNVREAWGSFTTVRENLPAVMRLAAEVLTEPAFDEAEFELLREELLASIETWMSDPEEIAREAFQRYGHDYPVGHPHYSPTFEEEIALFEKVTVDEAREFWSKFYGAQGGTMAVVGDFDPDEIGALIEELFGNWTADEPYSHVPQRLADVNAAEVDIETPDKANAMMVAGQRFRMRDDHPDYPALLLANYIMGRGLNSRLFVRIRGRDGLSYGVASSFSAHGIDEYAYFRGYATFAPENADKVVDAFREELELALAEGFTSEEVEEARRSYLDRQESVRAEDDAVAAMLSNSLFLDRPLSFTADQEAAIAALTPEELLAAMRRHIDPAKIAIFRAGDFANKLVP